MLRVNCHRQLTLQFSYIRPHSSLLTHLVVSQSPGKGYLITGAGSKWLHILWSCSFKNMGSGSLFLKYCVTCDCVGQQCGMSNTMPVPDLPVCICLVSGSLGPHLTPHLISLRTLAERPPRETLGPPGQAQLSPTLQPPPPGHQALAGMCLGDPTPAQALAENYSVVPVSPLGSGRVALH